jgi:hypothetical protein
MDAGLGDELCAPAPCTTTPTGGSDRCSVVIFRSPVTGILVSWVEASLRGDGLEELDGIARWVIDEDLFAAHARHDVVAKPDSRLAQGVDGRR